MDLEKAFRRTAYVLPTMAVISMAVAEGSILYVAAFAALGAAYYTTEVRGRFPLTTKAGNVLAVSAFLLSWVDYKVLAETSGFAMSHFLIEVQLVYLLMERTRRNYGVLFLVSLVNFILASSMTTEPIFALELPIFIVAGLWTLVLLNVYSETRGETTQVIVGRKWLWGVCVAGALVLVVAFVVFFIPPRLPVPSFGMASPLMEATTGFSDETRLGDIAEIKSKPDKIMRIWLEKDGEPLQVEKLLVRGVALTHYEGRGWSSIGPPTETGTRYRLVPGTLPTDEKIVERIELNRLGTRTLFAVYPEAFPADGMRPAVDLGGNRATLFDTVTDSILLYSEPAGPIEYTVEVRDGLVGPGRPLSADVRRVMLDLPRTLSPRARQLAQGIASGLSEPYAIAQRVETYLLQNFGYSMENLAWGSGDPVEGFLFETKTGNCEYFASAMVILLRSLGIPARFVNGFAAAEWNDLGGYYVVRQQDAHSWVEAYIDGRGWVTFDPTPSAARYDYRKGFLSKLQMWYDSVEYKWVNSVVNYGYDGGEPRLTAIQRALLLNGMPGWLKPARILEGLRGIFRSAIGTMLLLIGAAFFAALAMKLARRPRGRSERERQRRPQVRFYSKMLKVLRRKGILKSPSLAPMEFARRAVSVGGREFAGAERLTEKFCAVRYGGKELTAEELTGVEEALWRLRRAPRVGRAAGGAG